MGYILGIDGGATKTKLIVGDVKGNIICELTNIGVAHWIIGFDGIERVLKELLEEVLLKIKIKIEEIEYVYLGLTGADTEEDIKLLSSVCHKVYGDIPFTVVNDAWIILRSGTEEQYGVVAICGTGTNSAGINVNSERAILRSLGYKLGLYGGGQDIAKEAMHYAFRADEQTSKSTILETTIPKYFNVSTMSEVLNLFYPNDQIDDVTLGKIAGLVFEGANEGDEICQDILMSMATTIGNQTNGIIKQLKMEKEKFPVVVGGTVFNGINPLFIDQFTTTIHRVAPLSFVVKAEKSPVNGAYLCGLDEVKKLNLNL